jgi:hypothetical protein
VRRGHVGHVATRSSTAAQLRSPRVGRLTTAARQAILQHSLPKLWTDDVSLFPMTTASALACLDQDIADAEARLADLRRMRESIQPFIERYVGATGRSTVPSLQKPTTRAGKFASEVIEACRQQPESVFDVDDVLATLLQSGSDASKEKVRNSLYYMARHKKGICRTQRGTFTLMDTSTTPAAIAVEVNGESYEDSSGETGDSRDDTSASPLTGASPEPIN